ncbi:hypothetical protein HYS72_00715, partial [Candidatus Pacearchaeota archaeon]|nr:hypothetical protein [Candidatus Pacearchaeota archaeon]
MNRKNLIQKLKTEIIGISVMGSLLFSCSDNSKLSPEGVSSGEKNTEIAYKIIQIENGINNKNNSFLTAETLDSLIYNSKNYIGPLGVSFGEKKEFYDEEDLKKISKKIYSEINGAKGIKKIDEECYRNSLIYLAIGNAHQIPFEIVDLGEHLFIQYNPDKKHDALNPNNPLNEGDINIETTTGEIQESQNGKYSDAYYINEFTLKKESLEKRIHFKNLNEKELLSVVYTQTAGICLKKNMKNQDNEENDNWRKKAIEYCAEAIKLDSNSQSAYLTLGIAESMKNEFPVSYAGHKKAIKYFKKASELFPSAKIYYQIGNSSAQIGN